MLGGATPELGLMIGGQYWPDLPDLTQLDLNLPGSGHIRVDPFHLVKQVGSTRTRWTRLEPLDLIIYMGCACALVSFLSQPVQSHRRRLEVDLVLRHF